jgi:hypothetical protein
LSAELKAKTCDLTHRGGVMADRYDNEDQIEEMFDTILKKLGVGGVRDYVLDLYDWFEDKGFLTEKQYLSLHKLYMKFE